MWPGRVVVRLIFSQDGAQMRFAEDQDPIQQLAAQGADKSFADRVHPRRLDSGAQDRGAGGLEDGIKGAGEVRSAVTPSRCIRRVLCSMNTSTYSRFSSTVSACRKSTARIPAA